MALFVRSLMPEEQARLEVLQHSRSEPDTARRAMIVLLSSRKRRVHEISAEVGLHPINVRKWLHRFNRLGLNGLYPRRSPWRPRLFGDGHRREIIELAMSDPEELGLDFSAWSLQRLRLQLIERRVVPEISAETIRQELLRGGLVFEGRRWIPEAQ